MVEGVFSTPLCGQREQVEVVLNEKLGENGVENEGAMASKPGNVLFVCIHNAGRSQMAAAFLDALAHGRAVAGSAGTIPAEKVNPVVVEAMKEVGLDVSGNKPRLLTQEMLEGVDRVITMGCSVEEACPLLFVPAEDWGLEDPAGKSIEVVRRIRDEIRERVLRLLDEL